VECDNLRPLNKSGVCQKCFNKHALSSCEDWEEHPEASKWYYQRAAEAKISRPSRFVSFGDEQLKRISEFHKFWEAHHREILNARVDRAQARLAAKALSRAVKTYGKQILGITHQTHGLPPRAIAQVRFFTANQDFREPPQDQFAKYLDDPTGFDAQLVYDAPEDFLKFLGLTRLSQTDKRLDYARNAAKFLLDRKITAYQIAEHFGNDAAEIRRALLREPNMGYGLKKANMFIRDMAELNVWPSLSNLEAVDVASDINTMKVALRARILRTEIPLLSSFLDVFCYQYEYIDEMSARAWRAVWEEWKKADEETAPAAPCAMDFLLYRIGRDYCKDNLTQYTCPQGHSFYHFGAAVRNCRVCREQGRRTPAQARDDNLLKQFDGVCILESVCKPKEDEFRLLDPPKSISVKGQTSWTNSYSYRDRGGGGMMA